MLLLHSSVHSLKGMPCFTKLMTPPPRLLAQSFLMWKYSRTQMDSYSVIIAISAEFSYSISESSVIFGMTDLCLYLRPQAGPIFHMEFVYCCCPGK